MNDQDYGHITVFLSQAVENLQVEKDGIYVDATLGGGGHTDLLLKKAVNGRVVSFDQDQRAIDFNQKRFADQIKSGHLTLVHDNFKNLKDWLTDIGIEKINGVVFDLGVSSPQFDDSQRGFSYRSDSRLDMRMDQSQDLDAYKIINTWQEADLKRILHKYGEEKFAAKIVRSIITARQKEAIKTTGQLVDIIKESLPDRVLSKKGHPAKKTFQAIRIAVNDELNVLESALKQSTEMLDHHGRISVITFQSLEDRIVKKFFKKMSEKDQLPAKLPVTADKISEEFVLVNRHPIVPSQEEIKKNHRAHSAKLRVLERR